MSDLQRRSVAEFSHSTNFKIASTGHLRGEIIGASYVIDGGGQFAARVGLKLSVQPLDKDWKRTDDEPENEILSAGGQTNKAGETVFMPVNASGPGDNDSYEELAEGEVEGNALLSARQPDENCKLAKFVKAALGFGVPVTVFGWYAPSIIGLKGMFYQEPQAKKAGVDYKNDPTALVLTEVHQMPGTGTVSAPVKGATKTAGTGTKAASGKTAPTTATTTPTTPTPTTTPATQAPEAPAEESADLDDKAKLLLSLIAKHKSFAGKTNPVSKVRQYAAVVFSAAKGEFPADIHKALRAKLEDAEWMFVNGLEGGWEFNVASHEELTAESTATAPSNA